MFCLLQLNYKPNQEVTFTYGAMSDIRIKYILGQKSNDTNYCPYFQGNQCILELIEDHVCLGRHQGTKCLEKKPHHSYPHKSYLPIFDSIKLECSSLLRMRRNEFNIVQKSP